ncbi:hypothetical protein PQX77_004621 [Marasmius sp. AFHP31]|nr:hypothetical protein PQX77_004621 [Marasmius sp. AFHP31]
MKHTTQLKRTERAELSQSHHPRVDAALKDLKLLSKRLHSALSTYESELKVLERIYYKSKNQHRSALFWRRITETRRYGRRVEQIDLRTFVDALRLSFFREDNSKLLKGSWTHYPNESYISHKLEQCSLYRMREAARNIQSGAFIHLVLTVVAIVSRLALLSSELGNIVLDIKSAVIRLQEIHKPVEADSPQECDAAHIQIPSSNIDQSQDTQGVKSSRLSIPPSSPSSLPRTPKELDANAPPKIAIQVHKATPASRKEQVTSQPRPKKRKKKDEIDAIFGM